MSSKLKRDRSKSRELNLDDYEELEMLGQGGFGVVHKVRSKSHGAKGFYALKTIDLSKLKGKQIYEAQILEMLQHRNVVKYYGSKQVGQKLYILMEFCEGGNLDQYIKKYKPLPLKTVIDITNQLVSAITFLHEQNFMHRDLTIGNILFQRKNDTLIKIADFGLSRPAEKGQALVTKAGTAPFMSPDLFNGRYDRTADYYALGATLFTMLVGKPPPEPSRITFDRNGEPQGKFLEDVYKATLDRDDGSQSIALAAQELVRKLMSMRRVENKENINLEDIRKHDFMLCLNIDRLDKKSSLVLSSSQGFNNSYRPEPAFRAQRKRSRSNTRDSGIESGANLLYPRTGSTNGHVISMPTERRRVPSVDSYRKTQRAVVSNPNPTIAHSDRKSKAQEKWPVKDMLYLAPARVVITKLGRFIYEKEERRNEIVGTIIFEAADKNTERVYRIVVVENAGSPRYQRVTFYEPKERNPRVPNIDDPLLERGRIEGSYTSYENIPYDPKFSGLYNLAYKSHETVSGRVVQYELRNPFLDRQKGVTAKLYFNGDCRITVKEKGQYIRKEGTDTFVKGEPSSKNLNQEDQEYFAEIYEELIRYREKVRRWNPEKEHERAFINHDWRPKNS